MFTGIIRNLGRVVSSELHEGVLHLRIATELAGELRVDESVAVDGVCLTVVEADPETGFLVHAVAETCSKTTIGDLKPGDGVHLERAVRADESLGGHIVQGHVDGTGELVRADQSERNHNLWFRVPAEYVPHLVDRGSITINGVSLTIARTGASLNDQPDTFMVTIIPYTWENTHLGGLAPGSKVNLEFDIIGKYVLRFLEHRFPSGQGGSSVN